MKEARIYLSPPNVGKQEQDGLVASLASGWVAPKGPSVDEFEEHLEALFLDRSVAVLQSGTAALHLAMVMAGVGVGDHVLVSSFTFAACANVVRYQHAIPIFLDSERATWNLDPNVLEVYLSSTHVRPKAVIVTHLYGMPADMINIKRICKKYHVCLIEDAAESLGSMISGVPVGSFGDFGVLSFNGNKIVTCSTGGALICNQEDKHRVVHLAAQANLGDHGYHHEEVGYNYRLSNVLAGLGLAQLQKLKDFISRKRSIYNRYKEALSEHFYFLDEPDGYFSNHWLSCGLLKDDHLNVMNLINHLEKSNIESRRLWKPLHLHPVHAVASFIGTGVCTALYDHGICLPSGTALTSDQQDRVIRQVLGWVEKIEVS